MTAKQAPEVVGGPTPGTPLPWPQPHLSLSGLNWLVSEMPPIAGARLEADARYIVHACDCFPELLEALEAARSLLSWVGERASSIGYAQYLETEGQADKLWPEIEKLIDGLQDGLLASYRDQFDAALRKVRGQ